MRGKQLVTLHWSKPLLAWNRLAEYRCAQDVPFVVIQLKYMQCTGAVILGKQQTIITINCLSAYLCTCFFAVSLSIERNKKLEMYLAKEVLIFIFNETVRCVRFMVPAMQSNFKQFENYGFKLLCIYDSGVSLAQKKR